MMDDMMYRHVLFKDLAGYLKRNDYFAGYTEAEKRYIRANLGIDLESLQELDESSVEEVSYMLMKKILDTGHLTAEQTYVIPEFKTIYSSDEVNEKNINITYGLTVNPSQTYTLVVRAIDENTLDPRVYVISSDPNSLLWTVEYDPTQMSLADGIATMGTITYLKDENGNSANYDFKNIITKNGYTFQTTEGQEASKLCKGNEISGEQVSLTAPSDYNILKGDDIKFDVPVNNLQGTLNGVHITKDEINLSDSNLKLCVQLPGRQFIDYIDYDTLTHQLYEL